MGNFANTTVPVGVTTCDGSAATQRWRLSGGQLISQANTAYCLSASNLMNYGQLSMKRCASAANQQWQYDNQVLSINGYAVDLARESGAVIMYSKHGGNNQQWLGLSAGTSTENPAKYEVVNALGFYDLNAQGKPRTLRNDLQGTLAAQVQFAQSHTVDPAGNTARNLPSIVAEREALLLLTPSDSKAEFISVSVYSNGMLLGKLEMQHPNRLMASDYANGDNRTDVIYSRRAWSAVLPWNWVKPGLSLEFEANNGDHGELPSTAIEYAAPAELVLHSLRLGMLTNPPKSDGHRLLLAPEDAATDYFQTIPVARLVNAYYQDMQLDEVIVQNGRVYTSVSDNDQNNPHLTARITIHHAAGNYRNGVQGHGLSGGNGIATLYDSEGNELSHELGHNYGLGHYPGSVGNDYFWLAHHEV